MVADAYGWPLESIRGADCLEIWGHFKLARQRELIRQQWSLTAASFPWMQSRDQKAIRNDLRASLAALSPPAKSPFVRVPEFRRIEMIGSMLHHHGESWAKRHPQHMSWLRKMRIAPEEAVRRYRNALEKELAAPHWQKGGAKYIPIGGRPRRQRRRKQS